MHELHRHHTVVHVAKFDALEINEVDLDAAHGQLVEQALHELLRLVVQEKRTIEQIDADDPEGFLLEGSLVVEHPHVEDDLRRLIARMRLKFHAHPAVAFVAALVTARDDGIGEGEERRGIAAAVGEALDVELELEIERLSDSRGYVVFASPIPSSRAGSLASAAAGGCQIPGHPARRLR